VISQWCLNEIGAFWGAGKRIFLYAAHHDVENDLPPLFKGDYWTGDARELIRQVREKLEELARTQKAVEGLTQNAATAHKVRLTVLDCPVYGSILNSGGISIIDNEDNRVALVEFYRDTDNTSLSWIEVRAHVEFYDLEGKRIARLNDGFWHEEHEDLTQLAKFEVGDSNYLVVAYNTSRLTAVFDGHLAEHRVVTKHVSEFIPKFDKPLLEETLVRVRLLSVRSGQTVLDTRYDFRLKLNPFSLTPVMSGESS
jgi:hypothetical protein